SSAEGGASANKSSQNIETPVHMVLVDPFQKLTSGFVQINQGRMLLRTLIDALDGLADRIEISAFEQDRLGCAAHLAWMAERQIKAGLEEIGASESELHDAGVPRQFRRTA